MSRGIGGDQVSAERLKCPDCADGGYVVLVERWTAWVEFDPDAYELRDGEVVVTGGGVKDVGDTTGRVDAHCVNCDRWWKLRRRVRFEPSVDDEPSGKAWARVSVVTR